MEPDPPRPIDYYTSWLNSFIAERNSHPRIPGEYTIITDDGVTGWTDSMFSLADDITVTAQGLIDSVDLHNWMTAVSYAEQIRTLLQMLENMAMQDLGGATLAQTDFAAAILIDMLSQDPALQDMFQAWAVEHGYTQAQYTNPAAALWNAFVEHVVDRFMDMFEQQPPPPGGPPDPLRDPASIQAREEASIDDFNAHTILEHFIVPPAASASQRPHEFWKVQSDEGEDGFGYWYDLDADHRPDTYVEVVGGGAPGLYYDSDGNGEVDTIFINPYDIAGPDQ